jgi:hypothetical protein
MTFRNRLMVVSLLGAAAVTAYGAGRYYSPALISYVVEQALVQKLPQGVDPEEARGRYRDLMGSIPDRKSRLEKLLFLSQYLEKLQILTREELDQLLKRDPEPPKSNRAAGKAGTLLAKELSNLCRACPYGSPGSIKSGWRA